MARELPLDACVLINILATGVAVQIAYSNDVVFVITEQVAEETFYVRAEDGSLRQVDLAELQEAKVLRIVSLSSEEEAVLVELAAEGLGDGEAGTITLALCRGLDIATDDRRALRVLSDRGLTATYRTTTLVRVYCEDQGLSPPRVAEVIRLVRIRASYIPNDQDPEREWWRANE